MALSGWWKSLVGVRYVAPGDGAGDGRVEPVFGSGPPPLPDSVATPAFAEPRLAGGPPPLPPRPAAPEATDQTDDAGAMRRFGARFIDQSLAAWTVIAVSTFVASSLPGISPASWTVAPPFFITLLLSCALVLSALLVDGTIRAVFGNTLGKKVLKLEVVDRDGVRLSTRDYFNRNVYLWCTGFGCGAWMFNMIMPLIQLWRISHGKPATYDVKRGTRVRIYARLTTVGKILAAIPFILAGVGLLLNIGKSMRQYSSDDIGPITHSWVNPVTKHSVEMPDRWLDHTTKVAPTTDGLPPVAALEDGNGSMGVLLYRFTMPHSTTQDRARAYRDANASHVEFEDGGTFDTIGPAWERWTAHAVSRPDKVPRIVNIYHHDNDYWLLIAIDRVGASKESPVLKDLRDRVAQTILGRPQP
ncbi:hypothetical protein PPN31114_00679 [Pandoraea pneumonica]|jgi:uncharacterized RDD family membrane protein YckC|uniref:RDD domain-containing protein n=1 Tax=Pandoraea pneumonica TaxID=2508299 RepID=A0A5E4SE55_9BURK|nr:RDD family protein [Pandoraea pneumonica]VVD72448.1 hypothetical protein PPN31114_00679 [Pandoraea pneumonica]